MTTQILKQKKKSLTTFETRTPGSTDSNKKLGASLSSSWTKHRYATTGVRWSENMQRYKGTKFALLEASLNPDASLATQKKKKQKKD